MSALSIAFSRSIGRKLFMALSGLFLVTFLLVHVSGNTLLFSNDGGVGFNTYTKFMTTSPLIKVAEYILAAGFLLHIVYAYILLWQNNQARPVKYAAPRQGSELSWASRNMGLLGTVLFAFLMLHIVMFWGVYHFGSGEDIPAQVAYDKVWKITGGDSQVMAILGKHHYIDREAFAEITAKGLQNATMKGMSMYEVVKISFKNIFIVGFYVLAMVMLAFHLAHGIQSAFRTVGAVHKKYTPMVEWVGLAFAVVVPTLFGLMPVYFFFFAQ